MKDAIESVADVLSIDKYGKHLREVLFAVNRTELMSLAAKAIRAYKIAKAGNDYERD